MDVTSKHKSTPAKAKLTALHITQLEVGLKLLKDKPQKLATH